MCCVWCVVFCVCTWCCVVVWVVCGCVVLCVCTCCRGACVCLWGVVWCACRVCVVLVCVLVWHGLVRGKPLPRAHVQHASVCSFKTTPCVAARRPHVFNMRASCCFTRRRFETTHGGVLDMSTGGRGLSLPFSLLSSLFFLLFSLLFSSLLANKHCIKHGSTRRQTSRCDLARASQHQPLSARNVVTHVTILPSSPSPLLHHHHLSPPERGNFLLQEYFRRGIYFLLQF